MSNHDPKKSANEEQQIEKKLPLPAIEEVPEGDLDEVAGGMRADCTGCSESKVKVG